MKDITYGVIGCACEVHKILGPGLLESIYHKALVRELTLRGYQVKSEVPVDLNYKGVSLGENLRIDLLVNDTLVLELKSVNIVTDLHKKQLLTYLRLLDMPLGLLINFNEVQLKDGITRVANNYEEEAKK